MQADKQRVIGAINNLGRRVTASDVSAKTGLPLNAATQLLNRVASETRGNLEVSNDGVVVYRFAPMFETAYATTGIWRGVQATGSALFVAGYYLLRISFGVALILSVVAVFILIIVALIAVLSGGSDSGGGGDAGGDIGNFDLGGADLGNFFVFEENTTATTAGQLTQTEASYQAYLSGSYSVDSGKQKKSFLMTCYSFLFGDGNPNKGFDEERWQLIADHIRHQGGVTTAEQLAPYTGADPHDDNAVLPVLVRFEGTPEVTDSGNIVYQFPSLQTTVATELSSSYTMGIAVPGTRKAVPPYAVEKNWAFTNCPSDSIVPVIAFAAFNFLGAIFLLAAEPHIAALHRFHTLIFWLTVYGSFFVLLPICRLVSLDVINGFIDVRNAKRRRNYEVLAHADDALRTKLVEAKERSISRNVISDGNIVYTTERDLLDQEFDRP